MSLARLEIPQGIRRRMSYDKLAGATPRLLILESRYWLDGACANAARTLGWDFRMVPVAVQGVFARDQVAQLLDALVTFRPDFVLSINLSGMDVDGLFARMFEDLCLPYVTWFVDDPRTITMGRGWYASPYAIALTWEAAYVPYLSCIGFPVVRWVPLAADTTVFNAEPANTWDLPPTFVGNSMLEFADREWSWVREHPALSAAVADAFDRGMVSRERFAQGLDALLPGDFVARLDEDERRHAELLFFVEGTRRIRHALVQAIEPEGLVVCGDEGWRDLFPRAGGAVNYLLDLPALYRRCEVNINTTSIQMASAVNQRVFDCPAAGGFLLTDAQADLERLFDVEREVARYRSLEECVELLRWHRQRPAARREIALRARQRVLGEHTYAHRLRMIASIVQEHFGAAKTEP